MALKVPCPVEGCARTLDRRGIRLHLERQHDLDHDEIEEALRAVKAPPPEGGEAPRVSPFQRPATPPATDDDDDDDDIWA